MPDIVVPRVLSDFLLVEFAERGEILTNLKLQKLLYYTQAWYLALNHQPLFAEDFEAWIHGPVLPTQYKRFAEFKWQPIILDIKSPVINNKKVLGHVEEVIDVFGPETAVGLEIMTHNELPWIEARGGLPPTEPCNNIVKKQTMEKFYASL